MAEINSRFRLIDTAIRTILISIIDLVGLRSAGDEFTVIFMNNTERR